MGYNSFDCSYSGDLINELKRLGAMGLVQNKEEVGLRTIDHYYKGKDKKFNLKDFFYITENGKEYLQLREELFAKNQ